MRSAPRVSVSSASMDRSWVCSTLVMRSASPTTRTLTWWRSLPNADPPVCKVMDYGKFKYQQAMKAKQARKNQSKVEVKEMKFRPKIDVGDYETKKGHVLRFLKKGARVKITIMFRGREMAHPEQGLNVLERLAEDLKPFATVESQPKLEGRNMLMLLAPIKGAFDNEGDAEPSDK